MTSKIGYARVSTFEQGLDLQIAALKAAGCDVVRAEKRSGTSTKGRDELRTILDFIRAGDVLTVTRIDRLGTPKPSAAFSGLVGLKYKALSRSGAMAGPSRKMANRSAMRNWGFYLANHDRA
jgi:hypothetical protein